MALSSRSTNAYKIKTHALYTKPARLAVPIFQYLLFIYNLGIACTGAALEVIPSDEVSKIVVGIFCLIAIPVFLSLCTLPTIISRHRRTATPQEIQLLAALTFFAWIGYIFIAPFSEWNHAGKGPQHYSVEPFWAILASPGLVMGLLMWGFAGAAGRREKKRVKGLEGLGTVVELERDREARDWDLDAESPPPSYWSIKGSASVEEGVVR